MRNIYEYTKLNSGAEPEFREDDIFRTIISSSEASTVTIGSSHSDTQVGTEVKSSSDRLAVSLEFCSTPKSRKEMQDFCKIQTVEYFRKSVIKPMLTKGLIKQIIPNKPKSKNQKYVRT